MSPEEQSADTLPAPPSKPAYVKCATPSCISRASYPDGRCLACTHVSNLGSRKLSILDKVRKLRALAQSTNVNEAAAAAAAAERLIQEHNIAEAELHVGDDETVGQGLVTEIGSRIQTWRSNLLFYLADAYQCSGLYSSKIRGLDVVYVYQAFGRPQDIETLSYQYAFFSLEIERLCELRGKGRGRTWRNSFRLGAVQAIGDALGDARRDSRVAATSTALAVVDRRAELAKDLRDKQHPDLESSSRGNVSNIDGSAFAEGRRAGAGINQRSALGSGGTRLLGGGR